MKRLPFFTLLIAVAALVTHVVPGLASSLEFSREAIAAGQVWRLITGHLAHFSSDHLRWDLLVFLALGTLVELRSRAHFVACCVVGAGLISGLVWLMQPWLVSYRGLSGIDSALFVYVMLDVLVLAGREGRWLVALTAFAGLALFCAKVGFEFATGTTVFVAPDAAFSPVPLAHVAGAVVGAAVLGAGISPTVAGWMGGRTTRAVAGSCPTAGA